MALVERVKRAAIDHSDEELALDVLVLESSGGDATDIKHVGLAYVITSARLAEMLSVRLSNACEDFGTEELDARVLYLAAVEFEALSRTLSLAMGELRARAARAGGKRLRS